MDPLGSKTLGLKLGDLVFHQGDQRAYDQCGSSSRDSRKLIAERLSRTGGHDEQDVITLDDRSTDLLLMGPEF